MDDASTQAVNESDGSDSGLNEEAKCSSDELEIAPATTLIEVTPGVAVVFGEVPPGLELISLDVLPQFDRTQLCLLYTSPSPRD